MSNVITLQIGQCGNQVGLSFFQNLSSQLIQNRLNRVVAGDKFVVNEERYLPFGDSAMDCFFRPNTKNPSDPMIARALLIDMEPKVIHNTLNTANRKHENQLFEYDTNNVYHQQSGSANNWAYGFNVHGPNCGDSILEKVRKEAELCDCLSGFVLLQSMAGGTGSGMGCHISQTLRDEFPHSLLMNQVVWPHEAGEVIVQNYNTLLTLQKLYEISDSIYCFKNDQLFLTCKRLMGIESPSFNDMNTVIADHMSCLALPSSPITCADNACQLLYDPIQHLCSHPAYKIINSRIIPHMSAKSKDYSVFRWEGLMKHLHQMLIADAPIEECINWKVNLSDRRWDSMINKSITNLMILRGKEVGGIQAELVNPFFNSKIYSSYINPREAMKININENPAGFNGFEKTAFLMSNCQSIVPQLDKVISKAFQMFNAKAYTHHYEKHHVGKVEMEEMFMRTEQILYDYQHM
ncbi:hypothetical protein NAEGRDRAFT_69007 [Naegleria gruberi]|uniref:Tubulin delta chain n=1 Tax=Naegleria gruberi TaxID=5762 RepID=D2VJE2_NAEGR|nr:uncharacterized protein NAEGRDRAFT_69007 [Naegleria gruberi]EFC43025.1 hypothetical protein NAEGRDRAFT_69007 [Naegleria gruberi]|eukprot:XP_002675769.1 hypothetical protein NAEGRDRAFT_69007 [Naegleria gruberi strain NEG-M]